jgi:hypothetical protein
MAGFKSDSCGSCTSAAVHQCSDAARLDELLSAVRARPISADCTADSLHVGISCRSCCCAAVAKTGRKPIA